MRNRTLIIALLIASCDWVLAAEPLTAKVLGERVNLRAKADLNAEVVGQVSAGETLIVKSFQDIWVEVRPPESVDLWVSRDLIAEDKIAVNKANVRAGPGINYTVVGTLMRGDALSSKGTFGEWVRIAPFEGASLWVNKDLLEINYPLRPKTVAEPVAVSDASPVSSEVEKSDVAQPPAPQPMDASGPSTERRRLANGELIPLQGQGQAVEMEGILKPAPYLMSRPAPFRLARKEGNGFATVCYLKGNRDQLGSLRDQRLRIKGRQYWVQGAREPLLAVESIQKLRDL